ncbi:hypothetical protein IWQ56_001839, partial [Coemansia nantahalensis]
HTVIQVVTVVVDGKTETSLQTTVEDDKDAKPTASHGAAFTSTYLVDGSTVIVTAMAAAAYM